MVTVMSGGEAMLADMSRRKREIISSIAAAFALRGYHAVGMRELAQELGLNPGTLYHHFPSKDHALLMICMVGQRETHDNAAGVLDRQQAFPLRLSALFAAHISSLDRLGDFIDVFASQREAVPADLAAPLREGWRRTRSLFGQLFEEARTNDDIAPDTDVRNAIRLLMGVYRTANILHRTGRAEEVKPFLDMAAGVLLHGFSQ